MSLIGYARVSSATHASPPWRHVNTSTGSWTPSIPQVANASSRTAPRARTRPPEARRLPRPPAHGRRPGHARPRPPRATAAELISLIDDLESRGIGFKALNSPMDTTTPAGRAFLQIQAAFTEMEHNVIRQRVLEGVRAARGRKGGRSRIITVDKLRYARRLMADQSRSIPDTCREFDDMPSGTLYHYLHADDTLKDPGRRLLEAHVDREARAAG